MKTINFLDLPSDILKVIFEESRKKAKADYHKNKKKHKSVYLKVIDFFELGGYQFIHGINNEEDPRNIYLKNNHPEEYKKVIQSKIRNFNKKESFDKVLEERNDNQILCMYECFYDYGYDYESDKPRRKYLEKKIVYPSPTFEKEKKDWRKEDKRTIRNAIRFLGYKSEYFDLEMYLEFDWLKNWTALLRFDKQKDSQWKSKLLELLFGVKQ